MGDFQEFLAYSIFGTHLANWKGNSEGIRLNYAAGQLKERSKEL